MSANQAGFEVYILLQSENMNQSSQLLVGDLDLTEPLEHLMFICWAAIYHFLSDEKQ